MRVDEPPTNWKKLQRNWQDNLKSLLLKTLNKKQILILSHVKNNRVDTLTSVLKRISKNTDISISTLKTNAKILKDLGLIVYGNSSNYQIVRLTEYGIFLVNIIGGDDDG